MSADGTAAWAAYLDALEAGLVAGLDVDPADAGPASAPPPAAAPVPAPPAAPLPAGLVERASAVHARLVARTAELAGAREEVAAELAALRAARRPARPAGPVYLDALG